MATSPSAFKESAALPPGYRGLRGEILLEFKQSARGLTARDLVERLGSSLNTVRHYLKEMVTAAVISRVREQRGVGAPVHVYQLSAAGENLFPRRYDVLLTDILGQLAGKNGRAAVVEAMEERYANLGLRLKSELENAPSQTRLETVARILGEEGYMAAWEETRGEIRLTEHNCAIKAVAERFPEICEAEEKFLRDVLGAGVERRSHILSGCTACEYSIHFPDAGPDGDPGIVGNS
ncbi:MAG: hypothetical protein ABI679_02415 [Gemmatimonadota bacterium]